MTSPNIELWKFRGFTKKGAEAADQAIQLMMEAVKIMGTNYAAEGVFREACYQALALPDCTKAFQKRHSWKPPKRPIMHPIINQAIAKELERSIASIEELAGVMTPGQREVRQGLMMAADLLRERK